MCMNGDTTNLKNFLNELDKPTRNKFIQWILDLIDTVKQALTKGDKKIQAELSSIERQFTDMLKGSQKELGEYKQKKERLNKNQIVNVLTGKELDKNIYTVLARLNNGEIVTSEELSKKCEREQKRLTKCGTNLLRSP